MTATTMPMSDLLCQIGAEFGLLAEELQRLQDSMSGLLQGAAVDHEVLEGAQALDRVHQHAVELAKVVMRAAAQASPSETLRLDEVLDGVSLSALAHRLSGRSSERVVSGEMELF